MQNTIENNVYDVLIIGGGPAGLTAAIYASRAELSTLVLSGQPSGGQLMLTTDVENFPGFPEGILGPILIENLRKQAERFGTKSVEQNVIKLEGSFETGFKATTYSGAVYEGKAVILAMGASAKWLGLESEQKLIGRGVSSCATCDGYFFKDKVIAVVGGGDAAMEEATYLTKFASKVYVLVRGRKEDLRCSKIMQHRAFSNHKIEFIFSTEVVEVFGEQKVEGIKVIEKTSGEEKAMNDVSGLFVAIGHRPNTKFLEGVIELRSQGYIRVLDCTRTSKEGVFVAGDVGDSKYRQAVSAAGFGCMAALDVAKYLSEKQG
ncbi:MAG: Thioredoxin reductase, thioredoxin reductase (NADPH) [candidate division WWE3 bacterium GW2011_GWC1_41_7]|uniref:Thioredoxin reductase n=1 Tax=candidate division WWE3 bacterium GW2011_GWC1_41_7 TaxID=1619119 RepID=A0A0G0X5T0_UNCKA|nr:MAG: Thioredoxin reductase, thioredoxin reductase (NADPH) [candidate division WWE3 bacterium GW2011_GWC1_41_7]